MHLCTDMLLCDKKKRGKCEVNPDLTALRENACYGAMDIILRSVNTFSGVAAISHKIFHFFRLSKWGSTLKRKHLLV